MSPPQRPHLTVQTNSEVSLPNIFIEDETQDHSVSDQLSIDRLPDSHVNERGRQLLTTNRQLITPTVSANSRSRVRNSMVSSQSDRSRSPSRIRRILSGAESKKEEEDQNAVLMKTLVDEQDIDLLKADIKSALEGTGSWLKKSAPETPIADGGSDGCFSHELRRGDIELQEIRITDTKKSSLLDETSEALRESVDNYDNKSNNAEGSHRNFRSRLKDLGSTEHYTFGYDAPSQSEDRESHTNLSKTLEKTEPVFELQTPQYQPLILYGKSLGIFDRFSPTRRNVAEFVRKPFLSRFLRLLLIFQTALLSYRQWNPRTLHGYTEFGYNWADWVLLVVNIIFTLDVILKIIAWGFWDDAQMYQELGIPYVTLCEKLGIERLKNYFFADTSKTKSKGVKHSVTFSPFSQAKKGAIQRAYLRKTWNRLDFVSTICFWIDFFLSIKRKNVASGVPLFRALSCLRIFRLTNTTSKISLILKTIKTGLPQLMDVMLFLLYFWTLFAIIGTQSFKSSFRRFCVWINPDDPTDTYISSQQCGGYYEYNSTGDLTRKNYLIDGSPGPRCKGFLCPVNSQCQTLENPYNNMYSFDNILTSMQLTFVVMSGNTFSNIMYSAMDSESMAAAIYFIFGIFFLLLWMTNLLIAVISSSFRTTVEQMDGYEEEKVIDDFDLKWEYPPGNFVAKYYNMFRPLFDLLCLASVISLCRKNLDWTSDDEQTEFRLQGIISLILLIEINIRFASYLPSWRSFFNDNRNKADLFIALITSIISLPIVHDKLGRGYEWLTAFFIIRFYRNVLAVKFFRKLWAKVWRSISIIANLSFFFFTFLYLTSIIFSRYFENFASEDDISSMQFPFHTLPNAFLGLFAITSTENWSNFMYGMQALAPNKSAALFSAVLFMMWFMLSNSIILNLFIAIIGESLSVSEKEKRKEQVKKFVLVDFPKRLRGITHGTVLKELRSKLFGKNSDGVRHQEIQNLLLNGAAIEVFLKDELEGLADSNRSTTAIDSSSIHELPRTWTGKFIQMRYRRLWTHPIIVKIQELTFWSWRGRRNPFYETRNTGLQGENDYLALAERYQLESERMEEDRLQYLAEHPRFNLTLHMLKPKQPLRRLCQLITKPSIGKRYGGTEPNKIANTIFTVTASSATIAVIIIACYNTPLYAKNHINQNTTWNWALDFEIAFGTLFSLEFYIKIIADGVIFTPNAYFRNVWNGVDFIVLLSMWVNIFAVIRGDEGLSRVVRGFKALRALRLLTISETSKDIFHKVMIVGVRKIVGASFLSFTLLFPFTVWGLNLFSGRLGVCNDGNMSQLECTNEYITEAFNWNIIAPRAYAHPQLEFNRFASSLLTLFEVLSLEGWTDLLQNLTNSTGVGTPAENYASPENAIFMVLFIYIGLIFVLTLFVTVIIANYGILSGRAFLTLQQTSWNEVKKLLTQAQPRQRPTKENLGRFKTLCYNVAIEKNRRIRASLFAVLWIHVLAILLEKYPSTDQLDNFRYTIYFLSSTIFMTFTILKMIAIGPKKFFNVRWNVYEAFVFFGAFSTSFASFFVSRNTMFANINKLFLVGIFTVMIYSSNRLSHLLKIASASIPSLLSLMFTWAILFLVYAIALNQIFGLTRLGPNTSDNQNLRTVTKALILLFKDSFGEGWNYTMRDFAVEAPACIASDKFSLTDCGNMQYAYILFISWNIISMYIFVNMFVSLIFESFSYVYTTNAGSATLNREEIRKFKIIWQQFDPKGTGFIPFDNLSALLSQLDGYFAFKVYEGKWTIPEIKKKFIRVMNQRDLYDADVDIVGINRQLNHLDIFKVNERKRLHSRFIEEAKFNMELFDEPGVSFGRLILQIPLYARFDENNCLTLTDFLDRLVISRKLTERLIYRKRLETLSMIIHRWRYIKLKEPERIIQYFGEANLYNYLRKNPFENTNVGGSTESLGPQKIFSEEGYWSPTVKNRVDTNTMISELSDIANDLGKSQWRNELHEVNSDVDSFLSSHPVPRISRGHLRGEKRNIFDDEGDDDDDYQDDDKEDEEEKSSNDEGVNDDDDNDDDNTRFMSSTAGRKIL